MLSLTYLSSATIPPTTSTLESILAVSRRNNERDGLTGMLLYADGHFIQTLEGPDDAVDAAYLRISQDTRHRNTLIALRESVEERFFADWSMGFSALTDDEVANVPGFSDFLDPAGTKYGDPKVLGRAGVFHRIFRDNART